MEVINPSFLVIPIFSIHVQTFISFIVWELFRDPFKLEVLFNTSMLLTMKTGYDDFGIFEDNRSIFLCLYTLLFHSA